jgi:hypothetical protein
MEAVIFANTAKQIFVGDRPNTPQEVSNGHPQMKLFNRLATFLQLRHYRNLISGIFQIRHLLTQKFT